MVELRGVVVRHEGGGHAADEGPPAIPGTDGACVDGPYLDAQGDLLSGPIMGNYEAWCRGCPRKTAETMRILHLRSGLA